MSDAAAQAEAQSLRAKLEIAERSKADLEAEKVSDAAAATF